MESSHVLIGNNIASQGNFHLNSICLSQASLTTTQNNVSYSSFYNTPQMDDDIELQHEPTREKIYCQNVNGLRTKYHELYADVIAADFPVYLLTETSLDDTIPSN